LRVLILSVTLVMASPAATPQAAPSDFALRLEFGCSGFTDVIDTSAGTYVRAMRRGQQTARIQVSDALKDRLLSSINEARFFESASRVADSYVCEPSTDYRLEVTSNGKTHAVSWSDCSLPETTEERRRIKALTTGILESFQTMSSVKRLRRSDIICL
jgi:hypothetical protein